MLLNKVVKISEEPSEELKNFLLMEPSRELDFETAKLIRNFLNKGSQVHIEIKELDGRRYFLITESDGEVVARDIPCYSTDANALLDVVSNLDSYGVRKRTKNGVVVHTGYAQFCDDNGIYTEYEYESEISPSDALLKAFVIGLLGTC